MMERKRAILHTAGKTDAELLRGMVKEEDLEWIRPAAEAWDGAEVYVVENGEGYSLAGWDAYDCLVDAKVKEAIWHMEQDPMVGSYTGNRQEFDKDWREGKYEPCASITFTREDVEIQEEDNRRKLARLLMEHPDLPVICMVDSEIVAEDCCAWWEGSLGSSRISKVVRCNYGAFDGVSDQRIWEWAEASELVDLMAEDAEERPAFFDASGKPMEALSREEKYELARQQAWEKVEQMPWETAILLNINLPEACDG